MVSFSIYLRVSGGILYKDNRCIRFGGKGRRPGLCMRIIEGPLLRISLMSYTTSTATHYL